MKHVLNFRKQFAPAVECGAKRQTIRAHRKDGRRPKPGDVACCYTGLRTTATRLLREAPIVSVRAVSIDDTAMTIVIDGRTLGPREARDFAVADGFTTLTELFAFFREWHGPRFEGICIAWDPDVPTMLH